MSKEEIKNLLVDFICEYDMTSWSNEKVYEKFSDLIYKQISDLEAKLAESESELEKQKEKYDKLYGCYKKTSSEDLQDKYRLAEENEKLKQQLAEKDAELEKITRIVAYRDDMDRSTTINGVKFTNEQIITLQNIDYFADKHNQDKISFAVEQLEKVLPSIKATIELAENRHQMKDQVDIIIYNQIEELKKENR